MNNYIFAYYEEIKAGRIIAGRWIFLWYSLIVERIQSGTYIYDDKKAQKAIRFVENFCRHHEGALAPQLIKLELWQKALVSVLFGILDETGARQFRETVVIIARKNGKTLLAAAIANYNAFLDGEYGGRIYFAAPKLDQAALCFDAAYQMILKEPELEALHKKRRADIYIPETNTTMKQLAFNSKKSDGFNISFCVCDEIASWPGDQGIKFYDVLRSSFGSRRQPMMLSISTAGYMNDGIFDELVKRSTAVIMQTAKETRLAPFLYMIDDIEKWNDIDEMAKANPNIGVSITAEYLQEEIRIAEGSLTKKAEVITKYCNLKQNSSQAWLTAQVIETASGTEIKPEDFRHSYCVAGIDLSQTTDLTSTCIVVERAGELYVFAHFFMPAEKLEELTAADGVPYKVFAEQGFLSLSGTNFVDYEDCHAWIVKMARQYELLPLYIGYDRYSAQYLVTQLKNDGFKCDDVYQGYNLTPVIREFEGLIKDRKIHIGANNLLKSHLYNTALKQDLETQKVKIVKTAQRAHIDGVAALLDALTVRQKYFSEIGNQLKNAR